ncbi:hypothetical protein HN51_019953 [Arachis hypogaea]|uniref:Pentatricopeptide repeat-containing protein At3g15200 n=2 Tax=Arachis TaxID=3817 RepID=A0A9C6T7V2_ARADU|nr:putative pentatricopeptide repeat-containing protein At3g15200 [Arachis hypogaea]XP_029144386.1 putative pentatricopeptide repeat-containing protein At3g15200 [Arachis hypogaea]XP_052108789.1 putative pentatricopeptide repeat-containing protein At3g15200 [Arachis duranensis]XP_052108790.1 putative pentatricopeptide repeat-containing protein At3g15200 [Arachis duranensis]QHO31796.1 Putative pentatricopeptide repeat-containing protein [Arachis hypogaea]RYR43911.1 hypothetical protein Ahy_A08g
MPYMFWQLRRWELKILFYPTTATLLRTPTTCFVHSLSDPPHWKPPSPPLPIVYLQNLLKFRRDKPAIEVERALDLCGFQLSDKLVFEVLKRHHSDWRPALVFFNWACKVSPEQNGYVPSSVVFNEIVDILGKMKRFEELYQVLNEMSHRQGVMNELVFSTLIRRYVGAHKVEEAVGIFYRRKEFGLEIDSEAFRTLLMWLCRYKHVEDAETLFRSKVNELPPDIESWNVILHGWCILGNTHEAKRLWKDILASKCKPDLFTYATFIKAMTKKGKLGTALRLFHGMWDKGCKPDVVIYNCIVDALCFKKRVPEALEVFKCMSERGVEPNVATYNSLIKHMSKIRRMEKVYELVSDMERRKGNCLPNAVTYSYLLGSLKEPKEIPVILERMERNGCSMNDDVYNLVLRLYMEWDDQDGVRRTWEEMERNGWGLDRRSYTILIHGHLENGRTKDALRYFREMVSKGMEPEPRTEKLLSSMNIQSKERTEKQKG